MTTSQTLFKRSKTPMGQTVYTSPGGRVRITHGYDGHRYNIEDLKSWVIEWRGGEFGFDHPWQSVGTLRVAKMRGEQYIATEPVSKPDAILAWIAENPDATSHELGVLDALKADVGLTPPAKTYIVTESQLFYIQQGLLAGITACDPGSARKRGELAARLREGLDRVRELRGA